MPTSARYISYFDMHAGLNHGFLHPGRSNATEQLLSHIPRLDERSIVAEIGCGVGRTAELVLERFPCSYVGVDSSTKMLDRTETRLRAYRNRVTLIQCDLRKNLLPLPPESVDVLLAESVLAILEPWKILRECSRVLKHGGILLWNDRIWGDAVSDEDRFRVSRVSENMFGFSAAPPDLPSVNDWKTLAESAGLKLLANQRIVQASQRYAEKSSFLKKVVILTQLLVHPSLFRFRFYDWLISWRFRKTWDMMECWIFAASKE